MKLNTATTREQSDRLIAAGVDPDTADMCRIYWDEYGEQVSKEDFEIVCLNPADGRVELIPKDYGDYDRAYADDDPAWSLSALLALLPDGKGQELSFGYDPYSDERELIELERHFTIDGCVQLCRGLYLWTVDYEWGGFWGKMPQGKDPIEAVVQAIELLRANNVSLNIPKQ